METQQLDALLAQALKPHTFTRGDIYKTQKRVRKLGNAVELNSHLKPTFEYIALKDIEQIETQRNAKSDWAGKMVNNLSGFDWLAFGALSIARDPDTNINYCFDGTGRQLIAVAAGLDTETQVPCLVYTIPQSLAAKYFSYNQDKGRRKLSKEVIFINSWTAGDKDSIELGTVLDYCGLYIQGDTNTTVPHTPIQPTTAEIKFRTIDEGYRKIAKQDKTVCKQAKDLIYTAFNDEQGNLAISGDLYWAILQLLVSYPQIRKGVMFKSLQKYLEYLAIGKTQGQVTKEWKDAKGLSGNVGVSKVLAYNFLQSWKNFKSCPTSVKTLPYNVLES